MRASFAVEAMIFVACAWAAPVWAHDIDEVRSELRKQGFDQLEFSRTKPPFRLDACRGGERFHLHVDYYGKIIEQTSVGSCGEDTPGAATAPPPPASLSTEASTHENSAITSPAPGQPPKALLDAETPVKQTPAKELCSRYLPEVGKTMRVPCGQ
jgi:hypothetical protein